MIKKWPIFALLVTSLCVNSTAYSDANFVPTISVMGVSEIEVDPDVADVSVFIEKISTTSKQSREQVLQSITQLMSGLTKIGVAAAQIRQSQIHQGKKTKWEQGRQTDVGFFSTVNLSIEISKLENLAEVYDELAKYNDVRVLNTQFRHSNEQMLIDKQAKRALRHARTRANLILSAEDKRTGELLHVAEKGVTTPFPVAPPQDSFRLESSSVSGSGSSDSVQIDYLKIRIKSEINASFKIIKE